MSRPVPLKLAVKELQEMPQDRLRGRKKMDVPGVVGRLVGVVALGCLCSCVPPEPGAQQPGGGESGEVSVDVEELADLLVRLATNADSTIAEGFNLSWIMGSRLPAQESETLTTDLPTPFSYRVTAIGGKRIRDIEILVHNEGGMLLAEDVTLGPVAKVDYRPHDATAERVAITARAPSVMEGRIPGRPPLYLLMVSNRGGAVSQAEAGFNADPIEEFGELLRRITAVATYLSEQEYPVVHLEVRKLRVGEGSLMDHNLIEGRSYVAIGSGGWGTTDLDLAIQNPHGEIVAEDVADDNYPVVEITPTLSGKYTIGASIYGLEEGYPESREYWYFWALAEK